MNMMNVDDAAAGDFDVVPMATATTQGVNMCQLWWIQRMSLRNSAGEPPTETGDQRATLHRATLHPAPCLLDGLEPL